MRRRIRPPRRVGALRGLAAAALLLVASGTPRAEERAGPEDVHARLAAREVVVEARVDPESGGHRGHARFVVAAAPERVWSLVEDCGRYDETMIAMKSADEIRREGDRVWCRTVTDLPWPLPDPAAVVRARHTVREGLWQRRWQLVEGDFDVNEGRWRLTAFEDDPQRTLVDYRLHTKPEFPVPDWLVRVVQNRELPRLAEKLREQLE